jgi:hypothetical protein
MQRTGRRWTCSPKHLLPHICLEQAPGVPIAPAQTAEQPAYMVESAQQV